MIESDEPNLESPSEINNKPSEADMTKLEGELPTETNNNVDNEDSAVVDSTSSNTTSTKEHQHRPRRLSSKLGEMQIVQGYIDLAAFGDEALLDEANVKDPTKSNDEYQSTIGMIRGMSIEKKLTILTFCIAKFTVSSFYGLLAPFFPGEAGKKGASPLAVGFIFSVFQATIGIASPILGSYITAIGARCLYATGIITCGVGGILFGFLDLCPDGPLFVSMALIIRLIEGIGAGAFYTSSFAIIAHLFPGNVTLLLGSLELFTGLGFMTGPVIGGGLFELGGFRLPFITLGSVVTIIGIVSIFILPNHDVRLPPREGSVFGLLKKPLACIVGFCLICGTASMGFLDVTLSTFLKNTYKLSEVLVGFMFLVFSGMYAITAPIWGHLSDKCPAAKLQIVAGGFGLAGIAHVLMGPAPFLQIPHMLWLQIGSSVLMGIGLGTLVLSFPLFTMVAVSIGYPDNIATYGLAAGIFNGCFSIGACAGPIVGGYLVENLSFESAVAIVGTWEMLSSLILLGYIVVKSRTRNSKKVQVDSRKTSCESPPPDQEENSERLLLLANPK